MGANNEIIPKEDQPIEDKTLDRPSHGVGTLRGLSTWISLILLTEPKVFHAKIILEVLKNLDMDIKDLIKQKYDKPCPLCGVSLEAHRDRGGKCF